MMLGKHSIGGFLRAGLVLGVAGALSLACSGKSDDEDGDDADCVSLCEEAQSCPDADPGEDCDADCRAIEEVVDSYGCRPEFESYFSCIADLPNLCSLPGGCETELAAVNACLSGDPPSTCNEGGAPQNATCASLCTRSAACADPSTDCATGCADAAQAVAEAGCTAEYQLYMDCASTCDDICSLTEYDCPSSYEAFVSCMTI